jgi:GNAT superfamily N-acetyltransferase
MLGNALISLGATYLDETCCAVWTPPECDPWEGDGLSARFLDAMGSRLDGQQLRRLMVLNDVTAGLHPTAPHWYLGMLATRTAAQGSGAGSRMLAHTLRVVDADAWPAYLESTNPVNVPFYERHGFTVLGQTPLPDGPILTPMWRDAAV